MRRLIGLFILLSLGFWGQAASAQGLLGGLLSTVGQVLSNQSQPGVIVRTTLGLQGLRNTCLSNGCTVVSNLDGNANQLFLVRPAKGLLPQLLAGVLKLVTGILDAEPDQILVIPPNQNNQATTSTAPQGLWDNTPVDFYGNTVTDGYVNQPAAQIIRVAQAHSVFGVSGSGIVADIDTGVDPNHPALQGVLLLGYDFTRSQPGGSELLDVSLSAPPPCPTCAAAYVNQHTAAMLDQHTAAMLDGSQYAAFGHGTMVMGVIHLVAPTAKLLPLKAFSANGSGSLSNILAAIYYAVQNNANVINMSFDLTTSSTELRTAINYANSHNVICAASSGNDGEQEMVYPAGLQYVMGVASTNNEDQRSSFSNYGNQIVWVAAPGEGVITTYPFATYAAGWGTSFSSPMVAGTASLIVNMQPAFGENQVAWSIAHAKWIGLNMGNGRLDVYGALSSLKPIQSLLP
ncbi:MAG TPA: S8 family serine peptidase [Candidatus Sulfotelmatobacter sp.]|jgi:subtilisin family serine protease|nr:S8 family serine peptidase [Candidatus Sulfotelmatobacter sp.]